MWTEGEWLKYKRAIEKALTEVPVVNGTVTVEALWLETALPMDLIVAALRSNDISLPENVERVVAGGGEVIVER